MRALLVSLAVLLAACGGRPRASKAPRGGVLVIQCELPDAEIWVDSKYFREVAEVKRGLRLPAGRHRLELRRAGHHSMYYELEVASGERKVLKVELPERL